MAKARQTITRTVKKRVKRTSNAAKIASQKYKKCSNCGGDGIVRVRKR